MQVLVRALPGWAEVELNATAFVVMGEDRLLLALEAPEGTPAQPLTLGAMQVSSGSLYCPTCAGDCNSVVDLGVLFTRLSECWVACALSLTQPSSVWAGQGNGVCLLHHLGCSRVSPYSDPSKARTHSTA